MQIVIVEDSMTTRVLFQDLLQKEGYERIKTCSSPAELFSFLKSNTPDLILMDVVMPGMDGLQACRMLKKDEKNREVPIIVITSKVDPADLRAAFSAGAFDFIKKPVNPVEFVARVRSALTLKQEMDRRKAREKELIKVTELLEKANEQLKIQASQDGLTGIANRRFLDFKLEQAWSRAREKKECLTLLMVDIDDFKSFNDFYGHLAGDECLKRLAQIFQENLKSPRDVVCRYGGEEFVFLLPGKNPPGGWQSAEALRQLVEDEGIEHRGTEGETGVTVSIGVATYQPGLEMASSQELLKRADESLYQAKTEGKNRVWPGPSSPVLCPE